MRFELKPQCSSNKVSTHAVIAHKKATAIDVRNVKNKVVADKGRGVKENKKDHCDSNDVPVPRDSGVEIAVNDEKVVASAQGSPPINDEM
jgi:hypothetical protein